MDINDDPTDAMDINYGKFINDDRTKKPDITKQVADHAAAMNIKDGKKITDLPQNAGDINYEEHH